MLFFLYFFFSSSQIHNLTTSNEDKICNLLIQNKGGKIRVIHLLVTIIKALVEKIRISVTLYSVNPEF